MSKPYPSPDLADHVRQDTRRAAGALTPGGVVKVSPYCEHCRTAWPCPTVALAEQPKAVDGGA